MQSNEQIGITVLYCRLSRDDKTDFKEAIPSATNENCLRKRQRNTDYQTQRSILTTASRVQIRPSRISEDRRH